MNMFVRMVEQLEPRLVFSSVAGVAMFEDLNDNLQSVLRGGALEMTIDGANVSTGNAYLSSAGAPEVQAMDPEVVTFNSDGSFSFPPSEDDWDFEYNTSFRSVDGRQAGWLFGHDVGVSPTLSHADGAGFEMSFYVERPTSASIADFQGQWSLSMHQWTFGAASIGYSVSGTIAVQGTSFSVSGWSASTFSTFNLAGTAELLDGQGKLRLIVPGAEFAQTWVYLNASKSAMIGVSLSETLTTGVIFVATRQTWNNTGPIEGRYRVTAGLDLAMAQDVLGGSNVAEAGILDLTADGGGTFSSLTTGIVEPATWSTPSAAHEVVFVSTKFHGQPVTLEFYGTSDFNLMPLKELAMAGGSQRGAIGLAVKVGAPVVVNPSFDVSAAHGKIESGNAIVYIADGDENWFKEDLIQRHLPAYAGQATAIDVQLDLATGNLRASVVVGGSIVVFFFDEPSGEFIPANLTDLTGTGGIAGGLFTFQDSINSTAIDLYFGGLNAAGDIILYRLDGASGAWIVQNLGSLLRERGLAMPRMVGDLTTFVTAWGALNIVGLNEAGDIEAVWWHATTGGWTTNNLSDVTGAPPYLGRLTVFLTDWSAINIAGTTQNGSMVVTWWVPEFAGNWATSDFTALFGGPLFQRESVAAYVTSWGQMTVLGLDPSGEIVAYWWAPTFTVWFLANISQASLSGDLLEGQLTTQFTGRDEINIYGQSTSQRDLRFSWDPSASWRREDLTAVAEDR